jgi:hypothetical protein
MNFEEWLSHKNLDEQFYRTWAKTMMVHEKETEESKKLPQKELYRLTINDHEFLRFLKNGFIHHIKVDNYGIEEIKWYKDGQLFETIKQHVGKYRVVIDYYIWGSVKSKYFIKKEGKEWHKFGERLNFGVDGRITSQGFYSPSFIEYSKTAVNPLSRESLMKCNPPELFFKI